MKPIFRELDKKYIEVIGHYDDKVLCAKMTLLAELFAIEHKDGYALFKVEDYDKLSKIDDKLEFSVTDLTGTKWLFNEAVYITQEISYNINCSYDGNDFETIDFRYYTADSKIWKGLLLNENYEIVTITAQENPVEIINGNRVLEITGGTDATNSTLISWLETNATQIPTIVEKNITMHPVVNGVHDTTTKLYPKTKLENIVDIPSAVLGGFLHINETTGALEWTSAGSGSSSGTTYTAGTGISISSDVISVDSSVVAMQSDLPDGDFNINFNDTTSTPTTTVALQNIFVGTTKYTVSPGMSNPMTTAGDIIYGGSSGTPTRLAKGTAGQVLTMNSGATAPEWATINAPTYSAGTGIDITNNTIKATGVEYKNASGVAQGYALKFVKLTQTEYDNLQSVDANTLYIIYTSSASGYSGNITVESTGGNQQMDAYIKFDTAPASADDYDSYVNESGTLTGLTSYSNKTKVYIWGSRINSSIEINNVSTSGGSDYANAVEVTLSGNYDIVLKFCSGPGGSN